MARPRKQITKADLEKVERMAGLGLTENMIAKILGISKSTLHRRKRDSEAFAAALEAGQARAQYQVSEALFNKALSGDLGSIVWWEKTRAGRTDRQTVVVEEPPTLEIVELDRGET